MQELGEKKMIEVLKANRLDLTREISQTDFLPLNGTDYVEFYVGNAKQAAHFYQSALGFQPVAYSGPETGVRERASYVVRQNKITFVLSTPIRTKHSIADHIHQHPLLGSLTDTPQLQNTLR